MTTSPLGASDLLKQKLLDCSGVLSKKRVLLKRNEYLMRAGKIAKYIYIVKSGSMVIFLRKGGNEITLRFGYKGSWMTSFPSFLTGNPSEYYIKTIKKSELLGISRSDFYSFIYASPENSNLWIKMLEEFAVQQLEREIDVLTRSPYERYARLLQRSPTVFQEISNKHIAAYLRMSPETLSRLKKR